jgi:transposase
MIARMPTYLLLGILAGWLNRQQQAVIDYLRTENEIFKRQLKGRRPSLSDDERRRLAVKGKALGRKVLAEIACLVTPETILAWHRRLVAMKWTFRRRQVGRSPMANEVRALILEMARSESRWGYTSIRDRLHNLGYRVSRTTVANVLKEGGLEPAPKRRRRTSWSAFLNAQWPGLAAIDFTTVEVCDGGRIGDALRCVRDGIGDPESDLRGHHAAPRCGLDSTDRPKPHGRVYRLLEGETFSHHGSGCDFSRRLPAVARAGGSSAGANSTVRSQLQRASRALPRIV